MSVPDAVLRKAIDAIYYKYDRDRSNTLDKNQLVACFNQLLQMTGAPMMVNSFIVGQILRRMDKDGDGRISKPEFMNMFRLFEANSGHFMNSGNNQQQQGGWGNQPNNYNQGGFNQNQGGFNQGGYNQGGYNQGNYGGGYGF